MFKVGGDLYYMTGYTVDEEGEVELPYLGSVKVQGLTLEEAKEAVDAQVATLFKNYYLQVKLGGIRYSALGEFRSPGKKVILQNQATIFEAIAASGDLLKSPSAMKSNSFVSTRTVLGFTHLTF